jgi:hypothetical protein
VRLSTLSPTTAKEKLLTTSPQRKQQRTSRRKASASSKARFLSISNSTNQLTFIENKGQFDGQVRFQASNAGRALWLTQTGFAFDFQQCKSTKGVSSDSGPIRSDANSLMQEQITHPALKELRDCSMERHVIKQDFLGANQQPIIEPTGIQPGVRNYLAGTDPAKWQTQVRGFSEVVYRDMWIGIDLKLYGKGPDLEQEFIVKPGADFRQVQVAYKGIEKLEVGKDGSLLIRGAAGQMRESRPRIYQEIAGRRVSVRGRFRLLSATSYTLDVPAHNEKYPLVIDPTLLYSTFLGGSAGNNVFTIGTRETATGIAVDQSGNAYVTGFTQSADFPTTPGAFQTSFGGGQQTFVSKLNAAGSTLIYSTYLNASFSTSIAVDQLGNVYVAGSNAHPGFPTTANAYNPTCDTAGGSAFLTTLNPSGSGLVYSTCFGFNVPNVGGAPIVTAMTADSVGHAFVAGFAGGGSTLPTTPNAYQSIYPGSLTSGFVMEFDTTVSGTNSLIYSTYLGIAGPFDGAHPGTTASALAVDAFGEIYLTGFAADGFPVTPGAYQTIHAACIPNGIACPASANAFIAKLDPTSSGQQSLIYATYFGGIGSTVINAITVDGAGNAYVTGATQNTLPTTPGAFQSRPPFGTPPPGSASSVSFVTKLNPGGSQLVYSTFLAFSCISVQLCSARNVTANGIALDALGDAYVAGTTLSSSFPVSADAFQSFVPKAAGDFSTAFITKLNTDGSALVYSSYLGGQGDDAATAIAVDQIGDAYIVGHTSSANLPTTIGVFQPLMHGTGDAFVAKFPLADVFRLLGLSISHGGNTGQVTPTVFGSGFHAGCSASLVGGSQVIPAGQVANGPLGRFLYPTFDLTGAAPGIYSVSVTCLDGSSQTLANSFTVDLGGAADIWMDVTGRSAMRGGLEQLTTISVGNRGTVDGAARRIWVTFPTFLSYRVISGSPPTVLGQIGQTTYLAFDLPAVPAEATVAFLLGLTLPDDPIFAHQTFQIQAWRDAN